MWATGPTGPSISHGLVYQPLTDETFWAEKGRGAWLHDRRLRVSSRRDLSEALIATGVPYKGHGHLDRFRPVARHLHGIAPGLERRGENDAIVFVVVYDQDGLLIHESDFGYCARDSFGPLNMRTSSWLDNPAVALPFEGDRRHGRPPPERRRALVRSWALRDSNPRPSGCKPDALNRLS